MLLVRYRLWLDEDRFSSLTQFHEEIFHRVTIDNDIYLETLVRRMTLGDLARTLFR